VTVADLPRGQIEDKKMATKGHGHGHREDRKQKKNLEMDLELIEIRARMEDLALWIQQDVKTHWVYE
jgi:hypothetical protein